MIVIFTTNSTTYEEVTNELGAVDHKTYAKIKGVTIYKIPEIRNGITINLAYVNNGDALCQICNSLNREYVYNPCVKAYDLDDTYTAVATFLPKGIHIYT